MSSILKNCTAKIIKDRCFTVHGAAAKDGYTPSSSSEQLEDIGEGGNL